MFALLKLLSVAAFLLWLFPAVTALYFEHAKLTAEEDSVVNMYFGAGDPGETTTFHGNFLAVGSRMYGDSMQGAVLIFSETTPGQWERSQTIQASDVAPNAEFGYTIASDGTTLAVCAKKTFNFIGSSVYLINAITDSISEEVTQLFSTIPSGENWFGHSLSIDGSIVVIGSPYGDQTVPSYVGNTGYAEIFRETAPGMWTFITMLTGDVPSSVLYPKFGDVLRISGNNIVGATNRGGPGEVFLFYQPTLDSWSEGVPIVSSSEAYGDFYGENLALEGSVLAVGSVGVDKDDGTSNVGAVYIFNEVSLGVWVESQKLVPSVSLYQLKFGHYIDLFGSSLIIGIGSPSADWAFFFTFANDTWTEVDVFTSDDTSTFGDHFGCSVSLRDENVVAVGAKHADGTQTDSGAVYIFEYDPTDDCPGHSCEHGATCVDSFQSYLCDCPPSHGGVLCSDCLCENGGICYDNVDTGIGYCNCTIPNMVGSVCQKGYCNNGFPDAAFLACNCTGSGATGKWCDTDVNDCESNPCQHGGTCTDLGANFFPNHNNEFNCSCGLDSPYMGPTCEDTLCFSSPCLNGGTCVNREDFTCNCTETGGYEGEFCQTEIDECASNPCLNDGICTDLLGDFTCDCTGTGYEGLTCAMDVNDCLSSPCQNDGSCQDKGAHKFKCTCNEFWEGDVCTEDVDDCILKGYYCENGATCTDDPVNMGDVMCECIVENAGSTGKYCNVPIEDACVTYNPCFHGGKCIVDDITKAMSCDCTDTGYEGDSCNVQVYVSECVSSPCLNEGQCYDPSEYQDDWYCVCVNGYHGDICDTRACDSMPCQNGGTCTNDETGEYTCDCPENYSGTQCQIDEDEQVGVGTSSDNNDEEINAGGEDAELNKADKNESGDNFLIIVIILIIVAVLLAIGGFLMFKKKQSASSKNFMMPT